MQPFGFASFELILSLRPMVNLLHLKIEDRENCPHAAAGLLGGAERCGPGGGGHAVAPTAAPSPGSAEEARRSFRQVRRRRAKVGPIYAAAWYY